MTSCSDRKAMKAPPQRSKEGPFPRISRRDIVIGAGAAAVSALLTRLLTFPGTTKETNSTGDTKDQGTAAEAREDEHVTEANHILRSLPNEMHGARLEKYEVPGAAQLLVHVANKHHISLEYSGYFEQEESIERIQAENAVLIPTLMKHLGTFVIFDENLTPERMADYRRALEGHRKLEQLSRMSRFHRADILIEIERREKTHGAMSIQAKETHTGLREFDEKIRKADEIMKEDLAEFERINGCLGELAIDQIIEVQPALTEDAQNINVTAENYKNPDVQKKMFDDREDVAIAAVATADTGSVARLLYFGGKHDFRTRIIEWNAAHPDRKMSLVKVTCASLLKELQKLSI